MLARRVPAPTRTPRTAPALPADAPPESGVRPGSSRLRALRELHQGLVDLQPELYGRAVRIARSSVVAEDLVQDTVERALRFASHYQPGTNLRAWLHQILFSVFVTRCRRSKRERSALEALVADPLAWTYPEATTTDLETLPPCMARALADLPVGFRHALELVDLEERAYKDAAALLDVPVGTVMSRLHRGRRLLAESLRGAGAAPAAARAPRPAPAPALLAKPTKLAARPAPRSPKPAARPAPRPALCSAKVSKPAAPASRSRKSASRPVSRSSRTSKRSPIAVAAAA